MVRAHDRRNPRALAARGFRMRLVKTDYFFAGAAAGLAPAAFITRLPVSSIDV